MPKLQGEILFYFELNLAYFVHFMYREVEELAAVEKELVSLFCYTSLLELTLKFIGFFVMWLEC